MDVFQAAYRVAHDYEGGAVKLAEKMGQNPGTFLNRVNPETETHHLYLATSVQMQVVSGDHRILHAMAGTLGEVCFKIPDLSHVPDSALLNLVLKIGVEGGEFCRAVNDGLEHKKFTRKDFLLIREEGLQYIAAIAETMARVEGLIDE
jgi:hypothetical protein